MKKAGWLAFAAACVITGFLFAWPQPQAGKPVFITPPIIPLAEITQSPMVQTLIDFYSNQKAKPKDVDVRQAIAATEEAAGILCMDPLVATFASMLHRESSFDPASKGVPGEDSEGVAQTSRSERRRLRRFWLRHGVQLGPFKEIRTQVFFGVAVFYFKLDYAKGNVKDAVRRYNGGVKGKKSMLRAREYARRVMRSRDVIFKQPYRYGESFNPNCQ